MTKRIFAVLLCLLLCMSMLPVYSFATADVGTTEFNCAAGKHNLEFVEREEATCTKNGNIACYRCSKCHQLFYDAAGENGLSAEDVVIKAHHTKPDDEKDIKRTPATCTSTGSIEYTCTVCNQKQTEVIAKLKHSMIFVQGSLKNCTTDGVRAHYICSGCGGYFEDPLGEVPLSSIVIPASHNLTAVPAVEATCTTAGNNAYWHCEDCGKIFADSSASQEMDPASIPDAARGHSNMHVEAKAATCGSDGNIEYWYCTRCDVKFLHEDDTEAYTGETVISKTTVSHQLEKVNGQDATCTEAGSAEHWKCTVCGHLFSDAEGNSETTEAGVTINALGHSLTKTNAVAPTCDSDGNIAYWTCSRCGKLFSDADDLTEIQQTDTVDTRMEEVQAVEASCTQNGNIACWKCKGCGKYYADEAGTRLLSEEEYIVPKTDHNYVGGVCSVCSDFNKDYPITVKSEDTVFTPGSPFTISIDADFDRFSGSTWHVTIDGKEVDHQFISISKGSTVFTISSDALEALNLEAGTYDITISSDAFSSPVSAKLTVAEAPTTYKVSTASVEGGKISVDNTTPGAGDTVTVTATANEGYVLKANSISVTDANGNAVTVKDNKFTMPEADVTVTAEFTKGYTVAFNTVLPVDSVTPSFTKEVEEKAKVTKPSDPTDSKQHHKFLGWYKDAAYKTAFNFDKDIITSDTTLYAKWSHPYEEGICYYCWKANPSFSEVEDPTFVAKIIRGNGGTAHYGYYSYPFTLNTSYEYTKNSIAVKIGGYLNGSWVEVPVDPSYYDVLPGKSGGSVVSLKPGLIRMLPVGKYSIAISTNLNPITVNGFFRVSSSPKTGDDSNVALWVTVGVISAAAAAGAAYFLLRKRKK